MTSAALGIEQVLLDGGLHSVFQPIVDLDSGAVVAYEALVRGPQGPLQRPDDLFAAARAAGCLAELDQACRAAAFAGAVEHAVVSPLTLFVNVEPEVLDSAPLSRLLALAEGAPGRLRVVVEITERALATRPAELLRTVARIREIGWGIALDDVGADAMSLAFMPLLRPDVVKLDLRLVQGRPGAAVAQIMNAVNAYAQSSGAVVLAEGIEDEAHLRTARALGAQLGQGWFFGRPAAPPPPAAATGELVLAAAAPVVDPGLTSPFAALPPGTVLRRSPKALLIEVSKQLEREARRLGETCVVASTFQEARHFTVATRSRYRDLADSVGFVAAVGEGLPESPMPGVRGATLAAGDPVRGEWDVVVLAPHFAAALLARDLGDEGADREREFEYALTYDRDVVVAAMQSLLSRVAPRVAAPVAGPAAVASSGPAPGAVARRDSRGGSRQGSDLDLDRLLPRALAATTSGVAIADMTRPDAPLVYVNAAFEQLSGRSAAEVLGRNCRLLQGPDTDPAVVNEIRSAIAAGREWRGVLVNYRGPRRLRWWNEIHLAPVFDETGRLVQYIGVQLDVSDRVRAQQEAERERSRSRSYLRRIEELAHTDALTGLANRRGVERFVEGELVRAQREGTAVALLFCDLDGFKSVNDRFGHAAGDELLTVVAQRLRRSVRETDLVARLGGDEFVVALTGLEPASAAAQAGRVGQALAGAVLAPVPLSAGVGSVGASVGIAVHPAHGATFAQLVRHADRDMYRVKHGA
ncbi:diguanylate cyclase domain-containing protein [Kineococcus sp. SYSU DK001]|uniref:diguanylate cyclase domain-containing protein n=1 Tax=Kineococcus sp. SYSU DK001 TaxID=3383122 RepID=UPI003D7EA533